MSVSPFNGVTIRVETNLRGRDTLALNEIVEEVLEVGIEVRDVPGGAHEREHLPVRVRALPQVPGVACDGHTGEDLRADGLDTAQKYSHQKTVVPQTLCPVILTRRGRRARS